MSVAVSGLSPSYFIQLTLEHFILALRRSIVVVGLAGFFMGAVFVLQFELMLTQYNGRRFLGGLNTSSLIREVGPLIMAFVISARVGAFTTAELSVMRLTNQIDAAKALGTNPVTTFLLPRFGAIVLSSVFLVLFGTCFGLVGSLVFSRVFFGITLLQYVQSVPTFLIPESFIASVARILIFGIIVALVSCLRGYRRVETSADVGQAVMESAVYTNLFILFANSGIDLFL